MAGQHANRRLAAVVSADVAGYTRVMGADEEGTLARLRSLRAELIDPAIAPHGGRIVKTTGDICVFARVHGDVQDRLEATFPDGGEPQLKNISRPVGIWPWSPEGSRGPITPARVEAAAGAGRHRLAAIAGGAAPRLGAGAAGLWL